MSLATSLWPPARRRERARQDRLWDARWKFWFHCCAARTLQSPDDDAWWTEYRALDAEIKALTNQSFRPDGSES